MTSIEVALTAAASLSGLASAAFCGLYAWTRRGHTRLWWQSETGRNIMALGACLVLLAIGTVMRRVMPGHVSGHWVLMVAYLLTCAVMVWRTVMMWRANHPRQ